MDYFLTEQQRLIRNLARRVAEERIIPVRAELDEKEDFNTTHNADLGARNDIAKT